MPHEKQRMEIVLLALAGALLALRFLWLGDAPFVIDEPLFQLLLDKYLKAHEIPLTSFLGSSLPVPYGASALWIYAIPKLLFSHYMAIVYFHTFVITLGALFLYFGMRLWLGALPAAVTLLYVASSPFVFFYARHPWDNTFLMPLSALLFYLLISLWKENGKLSSVALKVFFLSITSALCINLHLMSGPMLLAHTACFAYIVANFPWPRRIRFFLFFGYGLFTLLLCLPYFWKILEAIPKLDTIPTSQPRNAHWGDSRNLWWIIVQSHVLLSVWGVKGFLEPVQDFYYEYVGSIYTWIFRKDILGWVPKALSLCFLLAPPFLWMRKKAVDLPRVYLFLCFTCLVLVYQFLNIALQPHYFQSVWWLGFAASTASIFSMPWPKVRQALFTILGLVILVNCYFIFSSTLFIHENHGTRGNHHGTGIAEEYRATKQICEYLRAKNKLKATLDVSPVFMPPEPVTYFLTVIEECKGIELEISRAEFPGADIVAEYRKDSRTSAEIVFRFKD